MKKSAAILILLLIALFCISCSGKDPKPNIVFILVDDLGYTDLSCYGSSFHETPNLDRLAAGGMVFTDAYSSSPVCSPTRASIMTGKYPSRVNITDWIPGDDPKDRKLIGPVDNHRLSLEEETIAEVMKKNGYHTFFAGKWHLGDTAYFPENQGFDINKGGHHMGQPPGGYYSPYNNPMLEDGPDGEYLTDRLADEALEFIKSVKNEAFFLYLSFYTVHTPIQASRKHIEYFRAKRDSLGEEARPLLVSEHSGSTTLKQVNADYASMVFSMDENTGRIIDYLDETGLSENTYIIFTSDNGGLTTLWKDRPAPTSVRPLRAGKGWCYEGGIRVPLIISGPGIISGSSDVPVISSDFYPSILDMAGIALMPRQHIDGLSLFPLLTGNEAPAREAIFWHFPHYHGSQWTPGAAIRKGKWKLIEFYHYGKSELYKLDEDVGETTDLSDKYPEKTAEMKALLKKMQEETGALLPLANPDFIK
ncbi:MAG: sulfatase [Bacteroidales bacterium]|jgi:arylsulfatase A-like enzyme|nr:sulfatase [Bacteroidales bacterium]